jgi:serine protease inhibitor
VVVNAIFFKGPWEHAFKENATSKRFFFVDGTDNERIKVRFMTQTRKHRYAKLADYDAQLVELGYQVNHFVSQCSFKKNNNYFCCM